MARGSRKTDFEWVGDTGVSASNIEVQTAVLSVGTGIPATLHRLRGNVLVNMDVGAADQSMVVGLGVALVSTDAFTVGGTSLPSPIDDDEFPWIWHQFVPLRSITGTQVDEPSQSRYIEVDSKAMRKVKPAQTLVLVSDSVLLSGSPTYDVTAGIRFLFGS